MENENYQSYEEKKAFIEGLAQLLMDGGIEAGKRIEVALIVLESEIPMTPKFYEDYLCCADFEISNDSKLGSNSSLEQMLEKAYALELSNTKTRFREAYVRIAENVNSEFTQEIFLTLSKANIFKISEGIANNSNPNISVQFLRTFANKRYKYDGVEHNNPLNSAVELNIAERQKLLLRKCLELFGTPVLPIYESVDMYEQLENFLNIGQLLHPEGINTINITEQAGQTVANLLDPGYEGSIPFNLAKLKLIINTKSKSWIHIGANSLLDVVEYQSPNRVAFDKAKKIVESLII